MVILIGEKVRKRPSWRIDCILKLNVSNDGQVRLATLKLGNQKLHQDGAKWDFGCPLCMLYPLELSETVLPLEPQIEPPAPVIAPAKEEEVEEIEIQLYDDL